VIFRQKQTAAADNLYSHMHMNTVQRWNW